MPMNAEQITAEAMTLPLNARAELADRLVVSLGDEMDPELEQLWVNEANRRFEELVSGHVTGVPLDEALAAGRRALDE
jgi:putative addiction module component (TIGR02574 family)